MYAHADTSFATINFQPVHVLKVGPDLSIAIVSSGPSLPPAYLPIPTSLVRPANVTYSGRLD